ncbi:transcription factor MYBS3-like [Aristolochia californica]|uniref:transcription factor MYBS3-like n=1 Tax=Aristolochia californica TaxID=171875 RepID=UPI0035DCDC64
MTRRCSHCCHNGHNSRTCLNRGVKLFGVMLTDGSIRKSASMGNLSHYAGSSGNNGNNPGSPDHAPEGGGQTDGYASEDFALGSSSSCRERKKGVPWTEEEHRMFLLGLQKLGKGDWRGIARNFVVSKTPTQVASHAQKYFIRQTNVTRRKRRSSLFDITADEPADTPPVVSRDLFPVNHQQSEMQSNNPLPPPSPPAAIDEECESMDSTPSNDDEIAVPKAESSQCSYPVIFPACFSPFFPFSFPFWTGYSGEPMERGTHEVVRPRAVHSKTPINVDELVGMSKLSLTEPVDGVEAGHMAPSLLSLKLLEGSTRQSAFHANPASGSSGMNSNSPIHAV